MALQHVRSSELAVGLWSNSGLDLPGTEPTGGVPVPNQRNVYSGHLRASPALLMKKKEKEKTREERGRTKRRRRRRRRWWGRGRRRRRRKRRRRR